jgi:hypothetical protein
VVHYSTGSSNTQGSPGATDSCMPLYACCLYASAAKLVSIPAFACLQVLLPWSWVGPCYIPTHAAISLLPAQPAMHNLCLMCLVKQKPLCADRHRC